MIINLHNNDTLLLEFGRLLCPIGWGIMPHRVGHYATMTVVCLSVCLSNAWPSDPKSRMEGQQAEKHSVTCYYQCLSNKPVLRTCQRQCWVPPPLLVVIKPDQSRDTTGRKTHKNQRQGDLSEKHKIHSTRKIRQDREQKEPGIVAFYQETDLRGVRKREGGHGVLPQWLHDSPQSTTL